MAYKCGHTPGPWRAGSHYITAGSGVVVSSRNMMKVEDAFLIAAAPEMLAALQAILTDFNDLVRPEHWKQIHDVIAKATGEGEANGARTRKI